MEKKILNKKYFLYLTEFFSGMSVMAVELGSSRLLAPYFSSSQIVWTIIIGTIMIAMALGNVIGGRWADKDPNPDKLYRRILIASLWIGLIPLLGKYIIIGIAGILVFTIDSHFLMIAAFLSCMILFVFPLFLLGTVTPSLVKYAVKSLDESGKVVGSLGAFQTIGSIIGTFIPTFVSIPAVGTSATFLIFSGVLLLISLIYFWGERKKKTALAMIVFLASSLLSRDSSFAFWQKNLSYEGESIYNYLQVSEDAQEVRLSTNVLFGVQSVYRKNQDLTGMYYDYALAAPYMAEEKGENLDILVLGNGTGTFAGQCRKYFPESKIETVEIDQKITDLAHRYFHLPEAVKVTTYDGRAYLNGVDRKYDVIMVDAYQDITIPFQMSSQEFFSSVKSHLKENGVMVVNMNMVSDRKDGINAYLSDTIASKFDQVYTVDVRNATNQELFAGNNPDMLKQFTANIAGEKNSDLADLLTGVKEGLKAYQPGEYLLTDDRAQVELLGMRAIDDIIRSELGYYREVYREEGLRGLMKAL